MGIVLDSSIIIAAERRGRTVREILETTQGASRRRRNRHIGRDSCGANAWSLSHQDQAQQQQRLEFIERLSSDVPVYPITLDIAWLAGRIEGQQGALGVQFAFEDLLIGATALHLSYDLATLNLRDFKRIPKLSVIQI